MGRRRKKGRPISGWLVVDKTLGVGSTNAVSKAKWLLQAQKAGHAGTLDPLATGVLPIAFGEATKTTPYIMDATKRYRFSAQWGASTSTDDTEGEVIARSDKIPSAAEIEAALPQFIGTIQQVQPKFSAVKIDGERAYDVARDGGEVKLKARAIDIEDFYIVDTPSPSETVFEAVTGKGAYVRALVRDLAKAVGTEGHVTSLRRLSVGPFHEDDAVRLENLEEIDLIEDRDNALAPINAALINLPQAAIDGQQAERLRRGQAAIIAPDVAKGVRVDAVGEIDVVLASIHDQAVAICSLDGLTLKPVRVFNL